MIKKVFANKPSFKTVDFQPGFNVVWADRIKESTKKDSRNGLGKSTLIEIIHFCLGAGALPGKGLRVEELKGWEFSLVMQIGDREVVATRAVDDPNIMFVEGSSLSWPIRGRMKKGRLTYNIRDWNALLGHLLFGLNLAEGEKQYAPTFRSLVSYLIRKGKDAFSTPFEHARKQLEWDKQVNNAFLLGLAWEDAATLQVLKDKQKALRNLKQAAQAGVVKGLLGSLGDLEAIRARLKHQSEQEASELKSFRVHLQYEQVQVDANRLTEEIHQLVNSAAADRRLLDLYRNSVSVEEPPAPDSIARLYEEAGVALPSVTLRRLEEVQEFHENIIENRRSFLADEIGRLERSMAEYSNSIRQKTDKRASLMEILETHGALDEYTLLQKRHMDTVDGLNSVSTKLENLNAFETGVSDIRISKEELHRTARRDYDERSHIRERAVVFFNDYSERLYRAPGKLIIDVGPTGFRFDIEIERSGSAGVGNMKVFCYDMTIARLWTERMLSPRVCVHDSTIFDGVDERQRALALEIAAAEAEQHRFQYICTLNSDHVPWTEFSKDFDLRKYIRVTLTDQSAGGCLLGIRF